MSQPESIDAHRFMATGTTGSAAEFWRTQLSGLTGKSCFPVDRNPGSPARTESHVLSLSDELTGRLTRMSRQHPAALHVLLAAGLVAVLGRYTREDDVVIGQPTEGAADHPDQLLVLRATPDGTFRELLMRMRDTVRDAITHQDFPLACLAGELGYEMDGNPYVDVAIELVGLHGEASRTDGAGPAGHPARSGPAAVRMLFTADRDGDRISITIRYDATRFSPAGVRRIARHYAVLLDAATSDPDRPLGEIDLWTPEDERIVAAANATDRDFEEQGITAAMTIHGLFSRQAVATPDAVALIAGTGRVTYRELEARANRLARTLGDRGIGPDRLVGVLAERSVEMMVAILAILKAGGAYLPIDPSYPAARVDYLLADSGASLVLAQPKLVELAGDTPVLDLDDTDSYPGDASPLASTSSASDLAYVIYTSGSSGNPKGVLVEHRSVVNRLAWMQRAYPLGPGDVIMQKTSISFDVSVWELFWWSLAGATLALAEPGAEKDPAAIASMVSEYRVTTMHFVPSMLTPFLGYLDRFGTGDRLGSLRHVFTSGEALTPNQARRFGTLVPGARLVNLYGPTEATVDVTHQPIDDLIDDLGEIARVPIGRPIDNIRAYVLDPSGRRAPVGVPGELHVAGVGVARGYLGRPELTAERFVDGSAIGGPGTGEDRLYRTGDLARWLDDGTLDYLGRVDLQVKIRGYRVEPGEIEERLRAHAAVADAAVIARDDGWQTSLRGFVVPREPVTEADLKQFLRETLPEYLVPARIAQLDALPVTANGKLDRAALRRPVTPRAVKPPHVEPRNEHERILAGIWSETLAVAKIGVLDNFFALGGNSIHFVSVLAKASAAGLGFTFQQLFAHQTIAALVAAMPADAARADGTTEPAAGTEPFALLAPEDRAKLPSDAADAYPLSMLQAGLIFQTEITGALGQYHDVLSYLIGGVFDTEAFTEAVRLLSGRHPMLRTTYHLTGFSEFIQIVHTEVRPPLTVADLRHLDPAEQERWHEDWLAAEKRRRFVWAAGELVSLHIQVLSDDTYRYTVSQHNSALDGWSISLLHTQLFDLYFRLRDGDLRSGGSRDGRPIDDYAADNHLRNFVGLEREAIGSPSSREFWLDVLRGSESTGVPQNRHAPDATDFRVILHEVPLPAGLTERIVALADSLSVPVKDVLLAAHVKVLGALAGSGEVTTGYEHSGRPELPGAEAALGLYLNTVPLRISLVDGSWEQLIRQIYRAELDLLPHRRYPMAKMKQDLGTQRTLFSTTFNFTHFYLMKKLRDRPEFALLDLRVDSETEFVFRTEFSRHFFDDDIQLCLHYHEHLFDADYIDRIGGYFIQTLELMTSQPWASHSAQPVADEAELELLRALDRSDPAVPHRASTMDGRHTGTVPRGPAMDRMALDREAMDREAMDRMAAVWSIVLGLPARDIRPSDDFFALGGNSLSALRVVLETEGLITLTDLTRHPRLDELAQIVDRRAHPDRELLHLLSSTAAGTRCALVCVPYPCGHPVNFHPLAAALEELTSDIVVYGLEAPGHDIGNPGEFTGVLETATLAVSEIADKVAMPVILWGHCGGAAVAIEMARQLEKRGHDLRGIFIGSKLLPPVTEMHESIDMIEGWTDEEIIRFMVDETGYTDLDGLQEQHTAFMGRVFRHDVCDGYRYFVEATDHPEPKIVTPFTFVVAADDAGLAHHPDAYGAWELIAQDLRLHVIDTGGHYFIRTNPTEVGELITRAWEAVPAGLED